MYAEGMHQLKVAEHGAGELQEAGAGLRNSGSRADRCHSSVLLTAGLLSFSHLDKPAGQKEHEIDDACIIEHPQTSTVYIISYRETPCTRDGSSTPGCSCKSRLNRSRTLAEPVFQFFRGETQGMRPSHLGTALAED